MRRYRVELVRESGEDEPEEPVLRTSADVARALRPVFEKSDREMFVVVLLNTKHRPIGLNTVSIGSLSASIVHGRLCCAQHKRAYVAAKLMWRSG
jgi:DNA repair protein RadC